MWKRRSQSRCLGQDSRVVVSRAEDIGVEEFVAELSLWIVVIEQGLVLGHFGVLLLNFCGWESEDFSPVGARVEGSEFFFDEGKDGLDGVPFGLPGEVNGEGGALIGHAKPEVVSGDGA